MDLLARELGDLAGCILVALLVDVDEDRLGAQRSELDGQLPPHAMARARDLEQMLRCACFLNPFTDIYHISYIVS